MEDGIKTLKHGDDDSEDQAEKGSEIGGPLLRERLLCELIGTFFLVLTVGVSVASKTDLAAPAIGLMLAVQIYTFGAVSGGLFNPAVTLAVLLSGRGKIAPVHAACYMATQLFGGVLGAVCAFEAAGSTFCFDSAPGLLGRSWVLESLFTMALCGIVLAAGTSKDAPNQYFGFAIGSAVIGGALSCGGFDQGSFNPAVTVGINFANYVNNHATKSPLSSSWIAFTLAPMLGGAFAAAVFYATRGKEYSKYSKPALHERLLAELVGTFMLVLTVGVSVAGGGQLAAVAIGLMLAVQVYTFGSVSGACLNPAVTLAVLLSGRKKMRPADASLYVVAQTLGGSLGGLIAFGATGRTFVFSYELTRSWRSSWELEILFTMALCGIVLASGTSKDAPNEYFGFGIGGTVIGAALACRLYIDQGSYNPAVTIGINLANQLNSDAAHIPTWWSWFLFIGAPLVGGVLAAIVFRGTRGSEYGDEPVMRERLLAEFTGTFFLVLTVGICVAGAGHGGWAAVATGLMLAVQVYTFATVSGACLNPAVTLAVLLSGRGKIKAADAGLYMVVQTLGGAFAGLCAYAGTGVTFCFDASMTNAKWSGTSLTLEILFTMALCGIVLAAGTSKDAPNQFFGFAIGSAVMAGALACSHFDQGSFNPAVTIGINIGNYANGDARTNPSIMSWLLFTLAPLVGAACAAAVFRATRGNEYNGQTGHNFKLRERLLAEMVGTFFLVLTVGCAVASKGKLAAVAVGLILAVQIYTFGSVSGACFNPAVTLAVLLSGRDKIDRVDGALYVVAQLVGAVLAGLVSFLFTGTTFCFDYAHEHSQETSFVIETLFTMVLCAIVLSAGTSTDAPNQYFGFAIGCAVIGGCMACPGFDQGSFNPAVTAGINIANYANGDAERHPSWKAWFLFMAAPLLGACVAAASFCGTRSKEYLEGSSYDEFESE